MSANILCFLYLLVGILQLIFGSFRPIPKRPIYIMQHNFIMMILSIPFWPFFIFLRFHQNRLVKKSIKANTTDVSTTDGYKSLEGETISIKSRKINDNVIIKTQESGIIFDKSDFKTRCPNCGYKNFHKKDIKRIEANKKIYQQIGEHNEKEIEKYSKKSMNDPSCNSPTLWDSLHFRLENIPLICNKCGHQFMKDDSDVYEKLTRKFGNEIAIETYRRHLREDASEESRER